MIKEVKTFVMEKERLVISNDKLSVSLYITGQQTNGEYFDIKEVKLGQIEVLGKVLKEDLSIHKIFINKVFNNAFGLEIDIRSKEDIKVMNAKEWLEEQFYNYEFLRLKDIGEKLIEKDYWSQTSGIDENFYYFRKHGESEVKGIEAIATILSDFMVLEVAKTEYGTSTRTLNTIK